MDADRKLCDLHRDGAFRSALKMIRQARIKGCLWPVQSRLDAATHYNPAAAYKVGDIVKIGQYLDSGRFGGVYDLGIWVIQKHGTTLAKTDGTALTGMNFAISSLSAPTITGSRIDLKTGGNPPSTGAVIAAYYAAISDGTAGFNLSDLSFAVTAQWNAGTHTFSASFSDTAFAGSDGYYFCTRDIAASSNSPASLGAFGNPAEHPLSPLYWTNLAAATVGEARTDCTAENAYEAIVCGRCGRPL